MKELKTVIQSKVSAFKILELLHVRSRFVSPGQCKPASSGSISEPIELTDQLEAQVKAQVISNNGTKLGLSKDQVDVLRKFLEDSGIIDLMTLSGRSNRTKFRDQVLNPLLRGDLVEMTQPNSPKSPTQKYRLTEKGQQLLNHLGNRNV